MAGSATFEDHPSKLLKVGKGFSLKALDPDATPGYDGDKPDGEALLADLDDKLAQLQETLFAESRFGGTKRILLVLQAMDTAGKGGIVTHVMGTMNPQGVQLKAFKAPTPGGEVRTTSCGGSRRQSRPRAWWASSTVRTMRTSSSTASTAGPAPRKSSAGTAPSTSLRRRQTDAGTKIVKVMLNISRDEQKDAASGPAG